jgi:hypothetical protein
MSSGEALMGQSDDLSSMNDDELDHIPTIQRSLRLSLRMVIRWRGDPESRRCGRGPRKRNLFTNNWFQKRFFRSKNREDVQWPTQRCLRSAIAYPTRAMTGSSMGTRTPCLLITRGISATDGPGSRSFQYARPRTLKPSLAGGNDFAFGGAETGPTAVEGVNPGDLVFQVAQYALVHPKPVGGRFTRSTSAATTSLRRSTSYTRVRSAPAWPARPSPRPRPTRSTPSTPCLRSARATSCSTRCRIWGWPPSQRRRTGLAKSRQRCCEVV